MLSSISPSSNLIFSLDIEAPTESGVTITELIETISKTLNIELEVEVRAENRTDIEKKRVGSVAKLKAIGWEPKYDLAKGVKETYEWISSLNSIR